MITLIVVLCVLLIIGYLVQTLVTGPAQLKNIIIFVLCIIALLTFLDAFGIINAPELRHR
jgi:hypothetical protein